MEEPKVSLRNSRLDYLGPYPKRVNGFMVLDEKSELEALEDDRENAELRRHRPL